MSDTNEAMKFKEGDLDGKYHYTWMGTDDRTQTVFLMEDYVIVKATDPEGVRLTARGDPRVKPDGTIKVGDAILVRLPKEVKQKRDRDNANKVHQAFNSAKEEFHATAASLKVPSFEDSTKP